MQVLNNTSCSIKSLDDNNFWTGQKLVEEINLRARKLVEIGMKAEDKVVIKHGGTPDFFADLFAVWEVGACAACINPNSTKSEIDNIVNFIKPKLILDKISNNIFHDAIDLADEKLNLSNADINHNFIDDDALILFTSGTTGVPKGVTHTFRSIISRISLNIASIPIDEMENTLCPLPTHFGHGLIGNCLTPLLAGKNLFLFNGSDISFLSKIGEYIDSEKISFLSSVPTMWKIATKVSEKPKLKTIQRIHIGSAPLSSSLVSEIAVWSSANKIYNMYGITETANWIAGNNVHDEKDDSVIGRMWGGDAAILSREGKILSEGHGEILIKTPSIMKGYYQMNDLTDKCFIRGWFRTGDIGSIDNNHLIKITGREKFEINRAGLKVNPEDIDILLEKNPSVDEACAFGVEDELSGEIVAVAVKLNNNSITKEKLREWCMKYLVKEKVPEKWFFVQEIPKNDRGKVDRLSIAKKFLNS